MKILNVVLMSLLAIATFNAHANTLCVKPDGSLSDPSISPEYIAVEELPACDSANGQQANGSKQTTTKEVNVSAKPQPVNTSSKMSSPSEM